MNWTILNVSIPVYDLQKSKQFYDMLIDYNENQKILYQTLYKNEESIFFGDKGFGLRLFKPIPDLSISNHIQSRRSYITLLVDNLENIKEKLELKDIKFIYKKSDNGLFKSLYVQEPSLNLIHLVENTSGFEDHLNGWSMGLDWGIHHMNLESLDVIESVKFFSEIIGFSEGKWIAPEKKGDFSIDPRELSIFPISNDNKGLHIIKPDDGFGYRNSFAHNPSIAGHPAFTVKSLTALIQKLEDKNILFSDAKVYAMPGFHQIYLYDINANMLEINQAV